MEDKLLESAAEAAKNSDLFKFFEKIEDGWFDLLYEFSNHPIKCVLIFTAIWLGLIGIGYFVKKAITR